MRFSIRDLVVLIAALAVLLALVVPAVLRSRTRARFVMCSNNLKHIGLALHNYHSAYQVGFPSAMNGTVSNASRLSGLVGLLPFVEHQLLCEQLSGGYDPNYPKMGPVPWDRKFTPWQTEVSIYRCPTDNTAKRSFAMTNYTFSLGDSVADIHVNKPKSQIRGAFAPLQVTSFRDFTDGTAHTIAMAEIATARSRRVRGQFTVNMTRSLRDKPAECFRTVASKKPSYYRWSVELSDIGRGGNWAYGAAGYSLFQTILPPNSPSCAIGSTAEVDGVFSASSRHPHGCHALFVDGAIHFITNDIDTGDLSARPPTTVYDADGAPIYSPYGIWGALGTRASKEGDVEFDR